MTTTLIIDDDERLCDSVKRSLERSGGFSVRVATSGEQGVELALECAPDIIILDLMMPRMTGADVAAKLRAMPQTARIPVVYLTGLIGKADAAALGGVIDGERYVAKPASVEELLEVIERTLGEVHARGGV